jgi:hypothetical protein
MLSMEWGVNSETFFTPALDSYKFRLIYPSDLGLVRAWTGPRPNLATVPRRKSCALVGNRTDIYRSSSP